MDYLQLTSYLQQMQEIVAMAELTVSAEIDDDDFFSLSENEKCKLVALEAHIAQVSLEIEGVFALLM